MRLLRRGTACLTLGAFLLTQFYYPSASFAAEPAPGSKAVFPFDIQRLELPESLGHIEERFSGTGNKTVILVQDAHSIPDAQKSIQEIIGHFEQAYGVDRVALEGAASALDPQIFRSYPDPKKLEQVLEQFARRGEIAGGVGAAIFAPPASRAQFYGMEDWRLYEEALALYLAAQQNETGLLETHGRQLRDLRNRKREIYSAELFAIDEALQKFSANLMNFQQVLQALARIKPPEPGSELAAMTEESAREHDPAADLEREVKSLAVKVEKYLKRNGSVPDARRDLQLFSEKQQEFNTSRLPAQSFALFLQEIMERRGLRVRLSAGLAHRTRNQRTLREIQGFQFFRDFEKYADSVKQTLFRSEEEKRLDAETRQLNLLGRLIRLGLSREDWLELRRGSDGDWKTDYRYHASFYENSEKRDDAFLRRLEEILDGKSRAAVAVAGGFHAQGLAGRLRERGIAYAVVMPQIDSLPETETYRDHMRGEVSWKNYFQIESGRVNLYKAFVRAVRDKLIADPAEPGRRKTSGRLQLKEWRDQIIRDLAAQGRVSRAGDYTQFIDEAAGAQPASGADPREQVEKFIRGLRDLESRNQLTETNILRLVRPATALSASAGTVSLSGDPVDLMIAEGPEQLAVLPDLAATAAPVLALSEVRTPDDGRPLLDESLGIEKWNVGDALNHLMALEPGEYDFADEVDNMNTYFVDKKAREQPFTEEIAETLAVSLDERMLRTGMKIENGRLTISRRPGREPFESIEDARNDPDLKGRPFIFLGVPSNVSEDVRPAMGVIRELLTELKNANAVIVLGPTSYSYGRQILKMAREMGIPVISGLPSGRMDWQSDADYYVHLGSDWTDPRYYDDLTELCDAIFAIEGYGGTKREFMAFHERGKKAFRVRIDEPNVNLSEYIRLAVDPQADTAAVDTAADWGAMSAADARDQINDYYEKIRKERGSLSPGHERQRRIKILEAYELLKPDGALDFQRFYDQHLSYDVSMRYRNDASIPEAERRAAWLDEFDVVTAFIEEVEARITDQEVRDYAQPVHDSSYWLPRQEEIQHTEVTESKYLLLGRIPVFENEQEENEFLDFLTDGPGGGKEAYRGRFSAPGGYKILLNHLRPEMRLEFFARYGPQKDQASLAAFLAGEDAVGSLQIFNANAGEWRDLLDDAAYFDNLTEDEARTLRSLATADEKEAYLEQIGKTVRLSAMRQKQKSGMASAFTLLRVPGIRQDDMSYATSLIWTFKGQDSGKKGWEEAPWVSAIYSSPEFDADRARAEPIWRAVRQREMELRGMLKAPPKAAVSELQIEKGPTSVPRSEVMMPPQLIPQDRALARRVVRAILGRGEMTAEDAAAVRARTLVIGAEELGNILREEAANVSDGVDRETIRKVVDYMINVLLGDLKDMAIAVVLDKPGEESSLREGLESVKSFVELALVTKEMNDGKIRVEGLNIQKIPAIPKRAVLAVDNDDVLPAVVAADKLAALADNPVAFGGAVTGQSGDPLLDAAGVAETFALLIMIRLAAKSQSKGDLITRRIALRSELFQALFAGALLEQDVADGLLRLDEQGNITVDKTYLKIMVDILARRATEAAA